MSPVNSLAVKRGRGIKGDVNASPISPRQILITRKEDLDNLDIPYGGLRENIIIEGIKESDFVPGALIAISNAKIRLTFHCEPCKIIADVVPSLKAVINRRGILGVIMESGEIAVGDKVECLPGTFKPLPEMPYQRFLEFMRQVPAGNVVTYKMAAKGIGTAVSSIRAMPRYIERVIVQNPEIPVHRIVDESGTLITKYVPDQVALLAMENVEINSSGENITIDLNRYRWPEAPIYINL